MAPAWLPSPLPHLRGLADMCTHIEARHGCALPRAELKHRASGRAVNRRRQDAPAYGQECDGTSIGTPAAVDRLDLGPQGVPARSAFAVAGLADLVGATETVAGVGL